MDSSSVGPVRDLSNGKHPVSVSCEIDVLPDSWVAIGIKMTYSAITDNGFMVKTVDFSALSDMNFDKLQYDIWGL